MADVASDLKQRFDWAMDACLEAYEVLPDGRSIERSDEDELAIGVFENLIASIDAIPPSQITVADELSAAVPDLFERLLDRGIQTIGPDFSPTSATEFIEILNRSVKRDMVG